MTASTLDAPDLYERLDPHGLLGRIAALPGQIEDAWRAWVSENYPLKGDEPKAPKKAKKK